MGLKISEWEQLSTHTFDVAEEALAANTREAMRTALSTISDLHDPETSLIFNEDGTVEVEADDQDGGGDDDDE